VAWKLTPFQSELDTIKVIIIQGIRYLRYKCGCIKNPDIGNESSKTEVTEQRGKVKVYLERLGRK